MAATRYTYQEATVDIGSKAIKGVQSVSLSTSLEIIDVQLLEQNNFDFTKSGLSASQDVEITITYLASSSNPNPFAPPINISNMNQPPETIAVGYPSGSYEVQEAVLSSASISVSVDDFLQITCSYQGRVYARGSSSTNVGEDARPENYPTGLLPYFFGGQGSIQVGGVVATECSQGFDITLNAPRKVIKGFGGSKLIRQPELPWTITADLNINKGAFIDIWPADRTIKEDQTVSISAGSFSVDIGEMRFIGISEDHSLDGAATSTVKLERTIKSL
jgi:hypothetical protein